MTPTAPADAGFKPLLKWPGGKWREWKRIAPHVPSDVRHFVDPFMGGLAPFARTQFSGTAFLNDRHPRLVDMHECVQRREAAFFEACDALASDWDALGDLASQVSQQFPALLATARSGTKPSASSPDLPALNLQSDERAELSALLVHSVADKARRLARLEVRHEMQFEGDDLPRHAETAVRAAYYTLVRRRERVGRGPARAADFLFVREYCYGSMFRTNAKGEFNIPYGGASYNGKRFVGRVAQLRSDETRVALARAEFSCGDFETLIGRIAPQLDERDLVFLDPPYHSDFSTYGPHAFDLVEHERLAAAVARLPCRWLLVIKETPAVRELYAEGAPARSGGHEVLTFDKQYGYNVRGRNARETTHLVMTKEMAR